MTLSDPLLRELKGHIIGLLGHGDGRVNYHGKPFSDEHEIIFPLCHCLESIFLKGLVRYDGFTPWKADCFQWFYQVVRKYQKVIPLVFRSAFEEVLNDKKTKSHIGKTRLLIRTCLRRKCLHVPLELHVRNKDFLDDTLRVTYRTNGSILGHEILSEIFLSLLVQLSNFEFPLDLSNCSFLDESWQIPGVIKVEMVPCERLGLTLGFPLGFPVIVSIAEHSAAAELGDRIEIGDILDEINGTTLRNLYGSKIEALFKKSRAEPFRVSIVKGRDPHSGQVYLPVIKLYRILGITPADVDMHGAGFSFTSSKYERKEAATGTLLNLEDGGGSSDRTTGTTCPDLLTGGGGSLYSSSIQSIHNDTPNLDLLSSDTSHQGSSKPLTDKSIMDPEERNIPIDKFYGEDGDHFIV